MSCCCSNNKDVLSFIQGDTFDLDVTFSGDAADEVTGVLFSSKVLNIEKELGKSNDTWTMHLTSAETLAMRPCTADYDITVTFEDNSVYTAAYRQSIQVIRKINSVDEEE